MKTILYFTACVLLVCFTGCGNNLPDDDVVQTDDETSEILNVKLELEGSINSYITRASDASWTSGDAIGVSVNDYVNIQYRNAGDNSFSVVSSNDEIYLTTTTAKDITAYYPYTGADGTSPGVISFTADWAAQANKEKIDFLFAKGTVSPSSPTAELRFDHKMSKVNFTFVAAEGAEMDDLTYTLYGMYTQGTFNTETGSVVPTTLGDVKDVPVALPSSGSMTSSLILIPQELEQIKVELCINNLYYEAKYDFSLSGGYEESYLVAIPKDPGAQLIISTITQSGQWSSGDEEYVTSE